VSAVKEGLVSVIVFASPSAVHNFLMVMGTDEVKRLSEKAQLAAIGPTTAAAIRAASLTVGIESEESSGAGMAGAIAAFYEKSSMTARNS
jgi:uroporphyrinogen-III synthase